MAFLSISFFSFILQIRHNRSNCCRKTWGDSNSRCLVLEATALSIVPHPMALHITLSTYLPTYYVLPTYLLPLSLSLSLSCTVDITLYSLNILIVLSLLLCEIYVVPIMSIHYNSLYVHTFLGYSSTLCLSVSLWCISSPLWYLCSTYYVHSLCLSLCLWSYFYLLILSLKCIDF